MAKTKRAIMQKAKTAFIFPGQGESHSVGMCKDFYEQFPVVKDTFEEASQILNFDLAKLVFEGPLEELSKTEYCQLAIYVVSVSVLRVIGQEFPEIKPDYCAGLSLGEYSAATASGVISFEQGVRLIQARGSYMQKACADQPSTMAVVLGLTEEEVLTVIKELNMPGIWVANINCPGQVVVSGTHAAIDAFMPKAKEAKAKRVLPLNVAGAFHSPFMQSAADQMTFLLQEMELNEPNSKLIMNVSGLEERELAKIKENLILQITNPVRWQASIGEMAANGVESFIEIGCGRVLSGLNKRMGLSGQTCCINSVKDLELLKNQVLATS